MASMTGYVQHMIDNNQTFNEFAQTCAKAFGALISLRDEPLSTPIPEEFTCDPYHQNAIQETQKKLDCLLEMSKTQMIQYGKKQIAKKIEVYKKILQEYKEINEKVNAMMEKTLTWTPPSPDHEGLKKYMIEQLKSSTQDVPYYEKEIEKLKEKPPMDVYNNEIKILERDIDYHQQKYKEEVQRVEKRNNWIKSLKKNLTLLPK